MILYLITFLETKYTSGSRPCKHSAISLIGSNSTFDNKKATTFSKLVKIWFRLLAVPQDSESQFQSFPLGYISLSSSVGKQICSQVFTRKEYNSRIVLKVSCLSTHRVLQSPLILALLADRHKHRIMCLSLRGIVKV